MSDKNIFDILSSIKTAMEKLEMSTNAIFTKIENLNKRLELLENDKK